MREAAWVDRVAKWRASGLSSEAFVAGRGFSASALRAWAARLDEQKKAATTAPAARPKKSIKIARVMARRTVASSTPIVIEVSGARVSLAAGFDRADLRAVLEILGAVTPTRSR